MKHGRTNTIALTIVSCLVAGTLLAAESADQQNKGVGQKFPGAGELKAYKAKQHKERREYFEKRREEQEAFRESLKENQPAEALPLIIANRKETYAETKTFMTGLYNEFIAFAKELFAKHEVPGEKLEQFLKNCQAHHDEMVAKHEERHNACISALEALQGKEGLTWEDIKEVMRAHAPERPEGHKGVHGRGHGKGKDKGEKED